MSCADELRSLLFSILLLNIIVGQALEVGLVFFGGIQKRLLSYLGKYFGSRRANVVDGGEDADGGQPIDLASLAKKKKNGEALTEREEDAYESSREMVDIISDFERVPNKSIKQGLGSTFYEYNELALQYGYIVMFSIALPVAPALALANNLVEVRSDALKMI